MATYSDDRRDLAAAAAREAQPRSSGWWRGRCPFCEASGKSKGDATFSVQVETGHWHCFRCHEGGSIEPDADLRDRFARAPPPDSEEARRPPDGFLPLGVGDGLTALCARPAREYLARRGVAPETVRRSGIGACLSGRYSGRVVLPVLAGTAWVGWVARDYTGAAEKKYLNPRGSWRGDVMFNSAALAQETDVPCLLVEGGFDALPFGGDAAAFLGTWTEDQIGLIKSIARRPLAVVLDGDAWEAGWALSRRLRMEGLRAGSVRLPPKKDPDQVDRDDLRARARASLEE